MTNTVRWYDRSWNLLTSAAIGTGGRASGVHFDGELYWTTDTGSGTVDAYALSAGGFSLVRSFTPVGDAVSTGITSDGHDLWVGVQHVYAGPPAGVAEEIAKIDKAGNTLAKLTATGYSPAVGTPVDLDWNGSSIVRVRLTTSPLLPRVLELIDVGDVLVYQSPALGRAPNAITFDGQNFPGSFTVGASFRGATMDVGGIFLTNFVPLAGLPQPYGATYIQDPAGDQVALIFRA